MYLFQAQGQNNLQGNVLQNITGGAGGDGGPGGSGGAGGAGGNGADGNATFGTDGGNGASGGSGNQGGDGGDAEFGGAAYGIWVEMSNDVDGWNNQILTVQAGLGGTGGAGGHGGAGGNGGNGGDGILEGQDGDGGSGGQGGGGGAGGVGQNGAVGDGFRNSVSLNVNLYNTVIVDINGGPGGLAGQAGDGGPGGDGGDGSILLGQGLPGDGGDGGDAGTSEAFSGNSGSADGILFLMGTGELFNNTIYQVNTQPEGGAAVPAASGGQGGAVGIGQPVGSDGINGSDGSGSNVGANAITSGIRGLSVSNFPLLVNNIVATNFSGRDNHVGISLDSISTFGTVDHNLIANFDVAYGDTAYAGANDILADPAFVDVNFPYNLRLSAGSPAIDAGYGAAYPIQDLDGRDRPQDGDDDGLAVVDIGAYEFSMPTLYLPQIVK
jgi:hypothetical protein